MLEINNIRATIAQVFDKSPCLNTDRPDAHKYVCPTSGDLRKDVCLT